MADLILNDLRFRDWAALYRIAKHPQFFYRALNDQNACIAWRGARYIFKAKAAKYLPVMRRVAKAIRNKNTHELLGCVVLVDIGSKKPGCAEIGIFIAAPYQGRGIATQALSRFIEWSLTVYHLQEIRGTAKPDNMPSICLQEHIGLCQVGAIAAGEGDYFDRNGQPEARIIMSGTRANIEQALRVAREKDVYSHTAMVL